MFEYLVFEERVFPDSYKEIRLEIDGDYLRYRTDGFCAFGDPDLMKKSGVYNGDTKAFLNKLEAFKVPEWKDEYYQPILDGKSWGLRYKEVGKPCKKIAGSNEEPDCLERFVALLFSITKKDCE